MAEKIHMRLPNVGDAIREQEKEKLHQRFLARGGYSPWINLLGQWGGVRGAVEAATPKQAPAPRMSLMDQLALEQAKQSGREKIAQMKEKPPEKIPQFRYAAANFAQRLQQSENDFSDLLNSGFDPTTLGVSAQLKSPTSLFQSKEVQRYQQLMDNFINATLREESGAVINPSEYVNAYRQYFPRAGDTKETLAQKARNRAIVLRAFKTEAGPALKEFENAASPEAAPVFGTYQGKTYKKLPDGNWELVE